MNRLDVPTTEMAEARGKRSDPCGPLPRGTLYQRAMSSLLMGSWSWIAALFAGHLAGVFILVVLLPMDVEKAALPAFFLLLGVLISLFIGWRSLSAEPSLWQRWVPAGIYLVFIFSMSNQSLSDVSLPVNANYFHPVEYAFLGILLSWAWYPVLFRSGAVSFSLRVLMSGALYGGLDEFHQAFVPGRVPSITDLGLDLFGLCLGLGLFLAARKSCTLMKAHIP